MSTSLNVAKRGSWNIVDESYHSPSHPLPTLNRQCPLLYYQKRIRQAKFKKASTEEVNKDLLHCDDDDLENVASLANLQNDVSTINTYFDHERQVLNKLSSAAIRSANLSNSASTDKLLALLHRWREIHLLLRIETLRRDAHLRHRNQHSTLSPVVRSVLSLDHFPRTVTPISNNKTNKSNNQQSTVTRSQPKLQVKSIQPHPQTRQSKSTSAWEGTVYKHKLLTSLYFKLSLNLVFTVLQVFAQQQRQRRRMVSSVPILREKKLLQVAFISLLKYKIDSLYMQTMSELRAKEFILNKSIRPLIKNWYDKAHAQGPKQRRLYVAAIAYDTFRKKQILFENYFKLLLHRAKMHKWSKAYRRRSGAMQAWLAWRYAFLQKHYWRTSMYERFTGNTLDKTVFSSNSLLSKSKHDLSAINFSQPHISQVTTVKECQALLQQEQSFLRQRFTPPKYHNTPERESFLYSNINNNMENSSVLYESPSASKRRNVFNQVKESRFTNTNKSPMSKHSRSLSKAGIEKEDLAVGDISGYFSDDSLSDNNPHSQKNNNNSHSIAFPTALSPLTPGTAKSISCRRSYNNFHTTNNNNNDCVSPFSPNTVSFASPIAKYRVHSSPSVSSTARPTSSLKNSSFVSYPLSPLTTSSSRVNNKHRRKNANDTSVYSTRTSDSSVNSQRSKLIEDIISFTSDDILSTLQKNKSSQSVLNYSSQNEKSRENSNSIVKDSVNNKSHSFLSKLSEKDLSLLPHGNEDDVDPLNNLPVLQRDAVYRFVQERRSKWYFQQCQLFFHNTLSSARLRRAFHQLHSHQCHKRTQSCWVTWQALHQKKQEEHRLCDAIHTFRHMKHHFQAWRNRFDPIYQLHKLHSDWLQQRQVKRLLRRRFQNWYHVFRERKQAVHAVEAVKQGVVRRVFGGWKSVIGLWKYTKKAEKVLCMKRMRPFFASWKTKCHQKRLLRRVFTVQEHAWSARSYVNSPEHTKINAFHILHSFFHAWNGYMRQKKQQRIDTKYYSLALCFRGASLLARHFIAWKSYHVKYKRLHSFYRLRQQTFLKRVLVSWRNYIVQVVKPETLQLHEKYHFRMLSKMLEQWQNITCVRQQQLATVVKVQRNWLLKRMWTLWRVVFKAKLLQKKLQLLTPNKSSAYVNNNTTSIYFNDDKIKGTIVWDISDTDTSSNTSDINSKNSNNTVSRISQLQQLTQQVQESLSPYKQPPLTPNVRFSDTIVSHADNKNNNNVNASNSSFTPVWTHTSQQLRAKRCFRIWRQFFYRRARYKRGFQLIEHFYYHKKMQDYFLQWPGRRQIMKAEKMRSFLLSKVSNPASAFTRLQLVEYDPDEIKRTKELHHTETRQREQEKAWEEELFQLRSKHNHALTNHNYDNEKLQRQEYLFLKQQRAEKINRERKKHPFSQNVVATRSFLQKTPPTLNELAYLLGYVQKIPDTEGLLRIKELLSTILFHWKRYIAQEKALRLHSVEVRRKTRGKILLTSLRKWIATTPRVSYRIVTWLNNAAERRAFLDAQRWAEHAQEGEKTLHETMQSLRLGA